MDYNKGVRKAARLIRKIGTFPLEDQLVPTIDAIEFTKELYDSHRTPETVDLLVSAILHTGNYEAVAELLDKEIKIFPEDSELHYDIAHTYLGLYHQRIQEDLELLTKAKEHLKKAHSLSPTDGRFELTMADIYWVEGKHPGAYFQYQQAVTVLSVPHTTPFSETNRKKYLSLAKKSIENIELERGGPTLKWSYFPLGDGEYHYMGIIM